MSACQRTHFGERQLLGIGKAAYPRELRGQPEIPGDLALDFAIEEEIDLP